MGATLTDYKVYIIIAMAIIGIIVSVIIIINKQKKKHFIHHGEIDVAKGLFIGDREFQEDAIEIVDLDKGTMAAVADGRGKNKAGSLSSTLAVQTLGDLFAEKDATYNMNYFFKRSFFVINREILKLLGDLDGGASVTCCIVEGGWLHYAVVGNTSLALYRNHELIPLSEGHTVSVLAKKGYYTGKISKQHALWALKEKRILNYVGQDGFKDIEIYDAPIQLKPKDRIVLMSDGITNSIAWHTLEDVLKQRLSANEMVQEIQNLFENIGQKNKDNGSIIIMKYKG